MAKGKPHVARTTSRNPELIRGLRKYGRVGTARRARHYLHSKKGDKRTPEQKSAAEAKKAALMNNDMSKSKFYAPDDVQKPLRSGRSKSHPTVLRKSLTPGAVVIILAGRFRGKRVVYLKQLKSGLLLVTGPYKINGVPLRRINQAYVMATSTKLDVSKVDVAKIDDAFFAKDKKAVSNKAKRVENGFLGKDEKKVELPAARKTEQKRVDDALKSLITAVPSLSDYLNAKFSLTNGQRPHLLKF